MNAVIVAEDARVAEELAEKLNERFENRVGFSVIPLQGDLIGKIKKMNPELLLTVDLAGFDRVTLTDNIAYNLLDCKQVHVICGKTLQNEKALEKALSIAMFFCLFKCRAVRSVEGTLSAYSMDEVYGGLESCRRFMHG